MFFICAQISRAPMRGENMHVTPVPLGSSKERPASGWEIISADRAANAC